MDQRSTLVKVQIGPIKHPSEILLWNVSLIKRTTPIWALSLIIFLCMRRRVKYMSQLRYVTSPNVRSRPLQIQYYQPREKWVQWGHFRLPENAAAWPQRPQVDSRVNRGRSYCPLCLRGSLWRGGSSIVSAPGNGNLINHAAASSQHYSLLYCVHQYLSCVGHGWLYYNITTS
jgi:hypothetical protein